MIIQRTKELLNETITSFRSFKAETEKRRLLELEWSSKMKQKFSDGAEAKQVDAAISEKSALHCLMV